MTEQPFIIMSESELEEYLKDVTDEESENEEKATEAAARAAVRETEPHYVLKVVCRVDTD